VLKVAGINSWTDASAAKLHTELLTHGAFTLPALRTLKLRQTSLSDNSINALAPLVPNLRRIDVSFTNIRRPLSAALDGFANLDKLSVTSTNVSPDDLLLVLSVTSRLHSLTEIPSQNAFIENVSIVGNTELAGDGESVPEFVRLVSRRLKKLNLSGLSFLLSQGLLHLAPGDPEEAVGSLQGLYLNSTSIANEATTYLSCCPLLETLGVAGTKLSTRFCHV